MLERLRNRSGVCVCVCLSFFLSVCLCVCLCICTSQIDVQMNRQTQKQTHTHTKKLEDIFSSYCAFILYVLWSLSWDKHHNAASTTSDLVLSGTLGNSFILLHIFCCFSNCNDYTRLHMESVQKYMCPTKCGVTQRYVFNGNIFGTYIKMEKKIHYETIFWKKKL